MTDGIVGKEEDTLVDNVASAGDGEATGADRMAADLAPVRTEPAVEHAGSVQTLGDAETTVHTESAEHDGSGFGNEQPVATEAGNDSTATGAGQASAPAVDAADGLRDVPAGSAGMEGTDSPWLMWWRDPSARSASMKATGSEQSAKPTSGDNVASAASQPTASLDFPGFAGPVDPTGSLGDPTGSPTTVIPPAVPGAAPVSSAVRGKGKPAWVAPAASAAVAVLLSLGIGWAAISSGAVTVPARADMSSIGSSAVSSSPTGKIDVDAWAKVASSVKGSVVAISAVNGQSEAKGSGAILDRDGNIVTNEHVVDGDGEISVTLSNGQIYKAKRVGSDPTTDLAVIRLVDGPKDLKPVKFADSSKLAVGQGVLAVGNPLGYSDTATTGVVSAVNRPVSVSSEETSNGLVVTNAVQIDAAINPGNSGGPTFDSAGRVIGVNSSIASTGTGSGDSSGSIGIGFAIPSNLVKRVTGELVKNGSVKHAQLGVMIADSPVTADGVTRMGAKITPSKLDKAVVDGGSADEAGLRENDVIVGWDGESVDGATSLMGYVRAAEYGSRHTVTFVRDGEARDVVVTLDHEEKTTEASQSKDSGDDGSSEDGDSEGGFDPHGFFDGLGW